MKILLFIIAFCTFQTSFSQGSDQKVIDHLGAEKAEELYSTNRDKYDHLLHFINHSWYVQDVSFKDLSNVTDIRTIKYNGPKNNLFDDGVNFNVSNFNPLLYDINIQSDFATTYRLGETGQIIVFYSRNYYIEKYKSHEK